MKKTFIDIRDRKSAKVKKTIIFKGDVSIIVSNMKELLIIEHENNQKSNNIDLQEDEAFSVRNWGN